MKGSALCKLQEYEKAREACESVISSSEDNMTKEWKSMAYRVNGFILRSLKRPEEALKFFTKAYEVFNAEDILGEIESTLKYIHPNSHLNAQGYLSSLYVDDVPSLAGDFGCEDSPTHLKMD